MTHFLFAVYVDDARVPMSAERQRQAWDDTGAFNDRLRELGALVYANGLQQAGNIVDATTDQVVVTPGLYISGPQRLGGFWIVDFPDEQTALRYAEEAALACNEPVEVRAFH